MSHTRTQRGNIRRENLLPEKSDFVLFVVFIAEKLRGGRFFFFTKFFPSISPQRPGFIKVTRTSFRTRADLRDAEKRSLSLSLFLSFFNLVFTFD